MVLSVPRNADIRLRASQTSVAEWSEFAAEFDDLSYHQTPAYVAEAARAENAATGFMTFRSRSEVAGLCALRIKKVPGLPFARGGLRWYDVGGVDPAENPGVYAFKKGLNGADLSGLGVFERAPRRAAAQGVALLETLYRRARPYFSSIGRLRAPSNG